MSIAQTVAQTVLLPATARPFHPQPQSRVQLPKVDRLSNIQPTDWAYQALQQLIERYGCVSGDIEHLEIGRRALTRYEYAIALNACFGQLRWELSNAPLTPEELEVLERLQTDFAVELERFGDRVASLNSILEREFSTTTKLNGEVLFQVADSFGDDNLGGDDDTQVFSGYRARLNLTTSLTGRDILQTRLQSRNLGRLDRITETAMSRLGTDGESDGEFGIEVTYEFPVTEEVRAMLGVNGMSVNDIATTLSPLSSSGRGAVSRFGRRDPGTFRGPGGTGAGIRYQPKDWLELNLGYVAGGNEAASPEGGQGLFNGSYSAIAQAVVEPAENLALAVTYARNFAQAGDVDLMGTTGSLNASQPFGEEATFADNWGFQVNWAAVDNLEVGGWFGYTQAYEPGNRDETETILNGAVTLALPDAIAEDNILGIVIGIPPIAPDLDSATSVHIEAFYRWQVDDDIQVTPGLFLITQPEHDEDRSSLWIGTIRTRFSF
ncbi:MAG: iron uptake porin [Cyanobacteriota bacterium]|nr:iron uptake porin [Cyanobacteriota bacterium]